MARQHGQQPGSRSGTSNRGFASMDENQQREIARMGGAAVSGNREHMAQIGRKGGEASAESRANVRSAKARSAPESERASDRAPVRDSQTTTTTLRSLGARSREDDLGQRPLAARSRDDDGGNRSLGGRSRDADTDDGGSSRGNAVGSPRNRDNDH
jgi:general stress protein YciG